MVREGPRAHRCLRYDTVRSELWPWLQQRGYASGEDTAELATFLDGLGRRDAHLRPRVEITSRWAWSGTEQLDDRGLLADELRKATSELLTTLGEPPLPVHDHGDEGPPA